MSGMTAQTFREFDVLLSDTIAVSQDLLNDIIQQINIIESFIPEKEYFWNLQLSALSSDITKFVEITTLLSKILTNKKKLNLPEIKQSHIHLLFVLKGINQAQQKHDSLVLEDLIKYELKDNLTQWKIDLIPLIKRQLNS
ncbi:MAG: hypothetical protein H0V66_04585 [Bdellovibrionales bacterium]|nr:hypothetical protein [Bdellovibrionales bacterium]